MKIRPSMNAATPSPKKHLSLRLRLSLFFAMALLITWFSAAIIIWFESEEYIHEFFDTQQLLFAKRLSAASLNDLIGTPTGGKLKEVEIQKKYRGNDDDDALSFAIFSHYGHELLSDGLHKEKFIFHPSFTGFEDISVQGSEEIWRTVWLPSEDGRFVVVVGQELDYRQDMVIDLMQEQLLPWLILLPILLLGLLWILGRELAPLRHIGEMLGTRSPKDSTPLPDEQIPSEVLPLVLSLNHFFERTEQMLVRERSLIATAAHELRTPLAGLRVQAEVAKLYSENPQKLKETLDKLLEGIDRSSHLVTQLLALSRVDAIQANDKSVPGKAALKIEDINWSALIHETIAVYVTAAEEKNIRVTYETHDSPVYTQGDPALISLLLRNILDNAVAYTPEHGHILIKTSSSSLLVENTSPPITQEALPRLGERFYRIPGQTQPGSGLGISIMKRIAEIHDFDILWGLKESTSASEHTFFVQLNF